jgi:demethylmenaquinone methyltransferase/2-methoxy-6-polyprenyl-1,4-benzoquinol methylase
MWGPGDVDFFELVAGWYDRLHPAADVEAISRDFEAAEGPVERVLDLAGGTGRVSRALDSRPLVVDLSRGMLRRAATHADAVQGDAARLPLFGASVEAIVCVDAWHHLPDPEWTLEECRRVLAPGGVFVLVDFDPGTVLGRLVALGEGAIGMESTFRTRAGVVDAVESAGFEVVRVEAGWATYRVVARRPTNGA